MCGTDKPRGWHLHFTSDLRHVHWDIMRRRYWWSWAGVQNYVKAQTKQTLQRANENGMQCRPNDYRQQESQNPWASTASCSASHRGRELFKRCSPKDNQTNSNINVPHYSKAIVRSMKVSKAKSLMETSVYLQRKPNLAEGIRLKLTGHFCLSSRLSGTDDWHWRRYHLDQRQTNHWFSTMLKWKPTKIFVYLLLNLLLPENESGIFYAIKSVSNVQQTLSQGNV